ncbi:MAG: hypothetical protein EAX86_13150 [Candidatus Heimdallarchaeota archaeon]|nr:hypothetical protein [Candidatus Heimdallarchaeota archaeon]
MYSLSSSEILVLIPLKGFTRTKSRIRSVLPDQCAPIIDQLVQITFYNTLEVIKSISLPFGVISPSIEVLNESKLLGAVFTYLDKGNDLNCAITDAIRLINGSNQILIVMPDLPFLTQNYLKNTLKKAQSTDILIVPSISIYPSQGTAILYLKKPDLLSFAFGEGSRNHFQKQAEMNNLNYIVSESDPFAHDLDTIEDVKFLENQIQQVSDPRRYISVLKELNLTVCHQS